MSDPVLIAIVSGVSAIFVAWISRPQKNKSNKRR
jgi:hypothetical protein